MGREDAEYVKQRWLLLVHQIPPKPAYFRAKVGRRLQKIGAVAIKNSVYVLPHTEQTLEDFQWSTREIIAEGGDATLCAASFVEGMRDEQVEALFNAARQADWTQVAEEAREALADGGAIDAALAQIDREHVGDHAHSVAVDPATHRVFFPLMKGARGTPVMRIMRPKI